MKYELQFQPPARRDLQAAYHWAAKREPVQAARWFNRFVDALETLRVNPERCPLADEHRKVNIAIREFLFGKRPNVFRVIFTIDADQVRILRIRRGQRRFLTRREINDALTDDADDA